MLMLLFNPIFINPIPTNDSIVDSLFMGASMEIMEGYDTMLAEIQSEVLME